ncbi:hypothetical protein PYCCODRAFT_1365629 [Trametes coccinea BRFM310]|uniref:Transposase domain-containing protein n=1 Tax=Trametes coccinea (strain BRFM310) TaxID=1353009 RepID=A0A1Y2IQJ7_TRAC3|nr:hypothetical protein PYCCODRAFT_1365629 [Trametes coccinea BRFM310]
MPPLRPVSPAGSEPDEGDDLIDVEEHDPLYVPLEELYLDASASEPPELDRERVLPPAFSEHPWIRRAYVEAFIAVAFHGATQDCAQYMLECARSRLVSFSLTSGYDIPGLARMAVTLRTAERRLGLDANEHITYYFLCDVCWDRHHPDELNDLPGGGMCVKPGCSGTLYEKKLYSDGKRRRVPVKVLSATSIKQSIQRMVLRPGKLAELNSWRSKVDDEPGAKPPLTFEEWAGSTDGNHRLYDMHDGWAWTSLRAGLERRQGGRWSIEDVDVHDVNQRFVALPNGLILIFNIDWFRALKRGNYSVGAIYLTICNNPRSKRFLPEETMLLAVIPGPEEPSLEQLNSILEIFVPELLELYNGIDVRVPGEEQPALVHGCLIANASDLPAARKASGLRGHTSKWFMCPVCKQPLHSLTDPRCFDPEEVELREEERFLKYAFRARDADPCTREEIAEERGIRWSALNLLPEWYPVSSTPTEFMHGAFLGEAKHLVQGILTVGGMFAKRSRKDNPQKKFEAWMDAMWWPGTAGRVPKGVAGTGKADQWRNLVTVLPPGLYESWQVDGDIPDAEAPPLKSKEKNAIKSKRVAELVRERRQAAAAYDQATTLEDLEYIEQTAMNKNYRSHFEAALEWCTAIRIWGSQSITVAEASRAQVCHNQACQSWALMNCHLTPYFHILIHLVLFIRRFGPVYAWWAYMFERFNGWLAKVNHNGHKGGELEATMMRSWVKNSLLHDLIIQLEALGEAKAPEDEESIRDLKRCLRGEKRTGQNRGTLLSSIAAMTAQESGELIQYPKQSRKYNLRTEDLYTPIFRHVRDMWKERVKLVSDISFARDGSPFIAIAVPFYSHIVIAGQRYGASTTRRGQANRYAYIDGRQAVEITHILRVTHTTEEEETLTADLAIVRPFIPSPAAADMPWATRAADLGIDVWKPSQRGPPQVVDVRRFSGHFALNYIGYKGSRRLWVTMSLCHDTQEPDRIDDFEGDSERLDNY